MERTQKEEAVGTLRARFDRSTSTVFLDYTGMTVAEVSKLRDDFRARGIEYRVVKNTLVKKALADQAWVGKLDSVLRGMTGVAWSFEEPSAAARVVQEFRRQNEKLKVKGGLLDGEVLSSTAVESHLATLPGKDEMRAMLLAQLIAPLQRFVMLMNAPAREFVGVLAAKQRKDEGA
ncbi:MAG: 50S ribosomal protein L10 [Polyangiaceae bacterium]|nr:50S ribosomal protein L10 [Polyangiaceae bacterium]